MDKTPQQRTVPRLNRTYTVVPDCRCDIEAREQAAQAEARRQEQEDWERRLRNAGIPRRYWGTGFETFEARPGTDKALQAVREYANAFGQEIETGLMIRGPKGTGKTHLASAAALTLLQRGFSVGFWNVPLVLDEIRASFNRRPGDEGGDRASEIMARARRAALLVLDDLATEKASDWVVERLYLVVEARYQDLKPVIVTTNASMRELEELLSPKTVSRLAEMTRGVDLKGPDYRLGRLRGG